MVIYNGKEMISGLALEGRIVEVNSPKSMEELIQLLKEGVTPDPDQFAVHSYRFKTNEKNDWSTLIPLVPGIPETSAITRSYAAVFTEEERDNLNDAAAVYTRPYEYAQFEAFQFNQEHEYVFELEEIDKDSLYTELLLAKGVLPTLLKDPAPLSELITLSNAGRHLMRLYPGNNLGLVSRDNPVPTRDVIELYQSMNAYEKRIINNGIVHPRKLADIAARAKSQTSKDWLLTKEVESYIIEESSQNRLTKGPDVAAHFIEGFANENQNLITRADTIFKAKYNGHAPRVLNEYMQGQLAAGGILKDYDSVTDEVIQKIADNFNQKNVAKVAKYRNAVLLGLDTKLDYASFKEELIQLLGVELPLDSLPKFVEKKFPEWLMANKNVNPSDLAKIMSYIDKYRTLDPTEKAKDIISKVENERGYADAKNFENKEVYKQMGYKFENNELAIRGRHVVAKQGNLTMRMLDAKDYTNFTIGYDTNCCQHYGNAGESCVYKLTSDPFAGAVVIERNGKVLAQGFIWTDEALDTLVFDNVEFANDGDVAKFKDLFAEWAKAMPYENIHVGTGYNQGMNGWGERVKYNAILPTTLDGRTSVTSWGSRNCYSDYHSDARAIKSGGQLTRGVRAQRPVEITTAQDEPTKWDELAKPDLAFMLNDWQKTPDERLQLARQFRDNPSEELQREIISHYPNAIVSLEHPCEAVQLEVLRSHPELIDKIKNPCAAIQAALIEKDPTYLRNMEHPSEEVINNVLQRNGLMLEIVQNPTQNMINTALAQNGYAWRFVPEANRTPQAAIIAATSEPKVVTLIDNLPEQAALASIRKNPRILPLIKEPSIEVQIEAVSKMPAIINQYENPAPEAVQEAVSRNGLMIRNFQRLYPELREVALRQNGFAIGCLKNVTSDEVRIAMLQNPKALNAVKDQELKAGFNVLTTETPETQEPEIV